MALPACIEQQTLKKMEGFSKKLKPANMGMGKKRNPTRSEGRGAAACGVQRRVTMREAKARPVFRPAA
jgi:hypothetical protein